MKARITELEATIAQHRDERARTAERLAVLDQDCAAALHEAKVARQVAAEVREAHARLDNEARAFRERLAEAQGGVSISEPELAASTETTRTDNQVVDEAVERDARWREERVELEAACRQARERSAELEKALARQQEDIATREHREATLRAELDAARIRAQDDPERTLAKAELERVRASLAETETTLQATRSELTRATGHAAALSKALDEITADRSRLAAELAIAQAQLAASTEAARRESQVAEEARVERDARWRQERAELDAACRQMQERSAELEKALARQQEDIATREHREATLRGELDAARAGAQDDPERTLAKTELERVRASLAEAETTLQATRSELTRATDQMAALSKSHDQVMTDRSRLAAELGMAEERAADLERRLGESTDTPPPSTRPIPF